MKKQNMLLLVTTTFIGLIAGLFFSWSVSVTPGLARLPDKEYIDAFQAMNRAIQNPLFFACFLGLILLLPAAAWSSYHKPVPTRFWLLLAASALYLAGVMGVTMAGNVPMNEALDKFNTSAATAAELTAKRMAYEATWNNLNTVRTISSLFCLILTVLACMISGNPEASGGKP